MGEASGAGGTLRGSGREQGQAAGAGAALGFGGLEVCGVTM